MAKEIVQADLGRIRALLDEVLGHSDYSDVQRMGGLTNRTYCVSFADGSRIMVRIPGEGTEELIDRADEKVSTELACRLGIDAKLYFFGDDGEKVSQFVPNAVTMSAETMRGDKRIRQAAQLLKTLHGSGVDTGVPFEVFDMAAGYEKIIEENSKARTQYATLPSSCGAMHGLILAPIEVKVGGATVFVLDVEQFHKY